MSISDRLDQIERDANGAAWPLVLGDDVPALLAALRAVLDLHQPFTWTFGFGPVVSCMECAERGKPEPDAEYPCPTVRAVTAALGEGLP